MKLYGTAPVALWAIVCFIQSLLLGMIGGLCWDCLFCVCVDSNLLVVGSQGMALMALFCLVNIVKRVGSIKSDAVVVVFCVAPSGR